MYKVTILTRMVVGNLSEEVTVHRKEFGFSTKGNRETW